MTLIALPTRISATAAGQRDVQDRQRRLLVEDYEVLRRSLIVEEQDADAVPSPLALLLEHIWQRANQLLGVQPDAFMDWLESTAPTTVSPDVGTGAARPQPRLADAMDELDSVLLTALAESERMADAPMDAARAEMELKALWARTFTVVAAAQEAWLEAAFIKRGTGIVTKLYPDPAERRRLYQYGFPPVVGRRFEPIAEKIRALLAEAVGYGAMDAIARIDVFEAIGNLLEADRGFGFRIRATQGDEALLERWNDVLGWWMNAPGATGPDAQYLRSWQRFVADNLEFRLGVAIGAVVAQAWSDGAPDATATPNLATWKVTTGLPWFGFWARELLRWGTHDPFVAFCLSQGLAQTREVAAARRSEFETWLEGQLIADDAENLIDPQLFQQWQASLPKPEATVAGQFSFGANLTGTDGRRHRYAVIPVQTDAETRWLDPAGFELAVSQGGVPEGRDPFRSDFELVVAEPKCNVMRTFRPN